MVSFSIRFSDGHFQLELLAVCWFQPLISPQSPYTLDGLQDPNDMKIYVKTCVRGGAADRDGRIMVRMIHTTPHMALMCLFASNILCMSSASCVLCFFVAQCMVFVEFYVTRV
jgi:hypothetical protein